MGYDRSWIHHYVLLAREGSYRECREAFARGGSKVRDFPPRDSHPMVFVYLHRVSVDVISRLITEDGETVNEDHMRAEIYIRGPLIMQGYLGNEEASAEAVDSNGWLKTGDIGYTENGKFYIVDRKKVRTIAPFLVMRLFGRFCPMRYRTLEPATIKSMPIFGPYPESQVVPRTCMELTAFRK